MSSIFKLQREYIPVESPLFHNLKRMKRGDDMKQERIERFANKLNVKLDEENRAIMNLKMTDVSNFLSPFYYDKPVISDDVAEYFNNNKRIFLWKKGVVINVISDVIKEEEQPVYEEAIKSYYRDSLIHEKRSGKRNFILALIMFFIGVIIFALMFGLDKYFELGLWQEVLDVVAWVFIWEAVDIVFIEKIEHANTKRIAKNVIESKVVFKKLTV